MEGRVARRSGRARDKSGNGEIKSLLERNVEIVGGRGQGRGRKAERMPKADEVNLAGFDSSLEIARERV